MLWDDGMILKVDNFQELQHVTFSITNRFMNFTGSSKPMDLGSLVITFLKVSVGQRFSH